MDRRVENWDIVFLNDKNFYKTSRQTEKSWYWEEGRLSAQFKVFIILLYWEGPVAFSKIGFLTLSEYDESDHYYKLSASSENRHLTPDSPHSFK